MENPDRMEIMVLREASGTDWESCMKIYHASFPEWEKEKEPAIASRVNEGKYLLVAGKLENRVAGFYILDLVPVLDYVMFSFLAVEEKQRGRGLGTLLCRNAIDRFRGLDGYSWLFIEAEDRQAVFYGHLGFLKLLIDYRVPRFDSAGTMPMHLMVMPQSGAPGYLEHDVIAGVVRNIFTYGYQLAGDDPRIDEQLARAGNHVELTVWPQGRDE